MGMRREELSTADLAGQPPTRPNGPTSPKTQPTAPTTTLPVTTPLLTTLPVTTSQVSRA
jgi:hypothetical protein